MTPYYADEAVTLYHGDEAVTLYHGDCRELVERLALKADCIVADPPYGETSLAWDRWPDGWPTAVSDAARSMWCFGSMRMFLDRRDEFRFWRLSQDVIWRKPVAMARVVDRFRRNHEHALHWYRGRWDELYREAQRIDVDTSQRGHSLHKPGGFGPWMAGGFKNFVEWADDGTRLMLTVIDAPSMVGRGTGHESEKPVRILDPLIRYACPPGGTVLDPFAGSGSTAEAARLTGRKAVLIEADERYCELIARRMSQGVLDVEVGP